MLKIILNLCAAYALLVAAAYFMQSRMLYLPSMPGRELEFTPADAGMDFDDVSITASDDVKLHGWFIRGDSDRVLLFFHGNAGNISHRLRSVQQFLQLGMSVFIVDYRGYGQSEGRATERGLYADADAAWQYLVDSRGVNAKNIVIFGRSLGASVAAKLAAKQQPLGLILESSFTSVPDIAAELYPWLPVRWLSRMQHATKTYVREVQSPVLVVHSRDDEIIPYHHGQSVFSAAPGPRSMITIRGGHNDGFLLDEEVYLDGVGGFLDSLHHGRLVR